MQAPARRLAPYWRKGYVAPKMELSDMSERLADMASKVGSATKSGPQSSSSQRSGAAWAAS